MNLNKKRMKTEPHVPFIAMADIAWQVVILFLVASAFIVTNAVNMDLPSMTHEADKSRIEPIEIIAGAGVLLVDKKSVDPEFLVPTLEMMLKERKADKDKAVIIACRPELTWQGQLDVMNAVAKAGGQPVISQDDEVKKK